MSSKKSIKRSPKTQNNRNSRGAYTEGPPSSRMLQPNPTGNRQERRAAAKQDRERRK